MQELRFSSSYGSIWHDCPCINLNLEKTKHAAPMAKKPAHLLISRARIEHVLKLSWLLYPVLFTV